LGHLGEIVSQNREILSQNQELEEGAYETLSQGTNTLISAIEQAEHGYM